MPWMRVLVTWKGPKPTALEALKHIVDTKFKMAFQPCAGAMENYQSLGFEQDGLLGNALYTAFVIQQEISAKYGVNAWIYINGRNIEDIVSILEREVINAAAKLKRTRSFFGDKRIQEIRQCLEQAVEKAVS